VRDALRVGDGHTNRQRGCQQQQHCRWPEHAQLEFEVPGFERRSFGIGTGVRNMEGQWWWTQPDISLKYYQSSLNNASPS
jgi:hypothetical protein